MFRYKLTDNAVNTDIIVRLEDDTNPLDKISINSDTIPDLVVLLQKLIPICTELKAIAGQRI